MQGVIMALFPAFAEEGGQKLEKPPKDLDWLNNKSFQIGDALSLHSRFLENTSEQLNNRQARDYDSTEEESGDTTHRRKKSEKKKKKKHKKKSRRHSESSASIFPSDLKREEETKSQQDALLASRFCWLEDFLSSTEQPFCVDRKPDPANWTYKSLYRGDVARYKRKGSSSLGVDARTQEISWEESDTKKKQKGRDSKRAADRYFSTVCRLLLRSELPVPVLPGCPAPNEASALSSASFLPLIDNEGERKGGQTGDSVQRSSVDPLNVYDSSTSLWRQGKGQQDQQIPDTHTNRESFGLMTGRTEEFNRQLREQPTDTQLWIQFIRYQDELNAAVFGGEEEQTGGESAERRRSSYRVVLEKKLSIAERAINANPVCIELQLERLWICQELWEPAVLAKEWKKLVFLHPNSAPLWREYLLFTQSYFSNFTVSKVNSAYGKCLSTLSAVRDGSMLSHPALPRTEEEMLDIFVQQCHFLRQSGHSEKAVSLFQAMIDFTFFKPDSVRKLTTKQQVEFFEPFWDSGEARVGEFGAKGWKTWMHQQERGGWLQPNAEEEEEEEDEDEEEVKDRSQPRWRVWLQVESTREFAHWLPWRPDKAKGQSEEDCEDPDRQVLFDDIGPSLICLSSAELQLCLLLHFLSFLGLPVDPVLSGIPCLPGLLLENLCLLTQGNKPQHPLTWYDLPEHGADSVGHMTTLQGARKCAGLGKMGEKFVTNVLNMILAVLPAHHKGVLSLSWIQYEKLKVQRYLCNSNKKCLRTQGKRSKQVVKRLLKEPENRSSLVLWREYAHLEWMLGNQDEARKVLSTASALDGSKGLSSRALCELCLLWSQLEVEKAEAERDGRHIDVTASPAVCILTRLTEGTSSFSSSTQTLSPVSILKARRSYEQSLIANLSALENLCGLQSREKGIEDVLRLRSLVGCYALFQYLTVNIQAANAVYTQARDRVDALYHTLTLEQKQGSSSEARRFAADPSSTSAPQHSIRRLASECEALAVQQACLLRHHNTVSVFPLSMLRETLTSSLVTCSSSAPLWSIYLQVENRYHSAGRARRFFHSVSRDNSSIVPRLFAIVAEQQRKQLVDAAQRSCCHDDALPMLPENGLSNRIRGLFESTSVTKMGAHCPLLWRMYVYFLVSEGKTDKAKGIFYKALQNIPWVKGLYMDAVQLFPENPQEFVDLMTEKEIRLRLPLEELDILLED
ncbi:protein NRDE2 homolog [Gouania willdenowi]|nr:protein NRDE2 homolog [Gouania willdenowi]